MTTTSKGVTRENYNQLVRETHEYVLRSFPTFYENLTDVEAALLIQSWLEDSIHTIERNFYNDGMLRGWCYKILVEEAREQTGIDLADSVAVLSNELGYSSGAVISKILRESVPNQPQKQKYSNGAMRKLDVSDILKPAPVAIEYDVALDVTKCKS